MNHDLKKFCICNLLLTHAAFNVVQFEWRIIIVSWANIRDQDRAILAMFIKIQLKNIHSRAFFCAKILPIRKFTIANFSSSPLNSCKCTIFVNHICLKIIKKCLVYSDRENVARRYLLCSIYSNYNMNIRIYDKLVLLKYEA